MGDIFISYSRTDTDYAHNLAESLQSRGLHVWIDERLDDRARRFHKRKKRLNNCDAFLVIMTPNSFASERVQRDFQYARQQSKPIFLLWLGGEEPWFSGELTTCYDVRGNKLPEAPFYSAVEEVAIGDQIIAGIPAMGASVPIPEGIMVKEPEVNSLLEVAIADETEVSQFLEPIAGDEEVDFVPEETVTEEPETSLLQAESPSEELALSQPPEETLAEQPELNSLREEYVNEATEVSTSPKATPRESPEVSPLPRTSRRTIVSRVLALVAIIVAIGAVIFSQRSEQLNDVTTASLRLAATTLALPPTPSTDPIPRIRNYEISLCCGYPGRQRSGSLDFSVSVETTDLLQVEFAMEGEQVCSDLVLHILWDNDEIHLTGPIGPVSGNLTTGLIDLSEDITPGRHTLTISPEGREGGCNGGGLPKWAGKLTLHTSADPQ